MTWLNAFTSEELRGRKILNLHPEPNSTLETRIIVGKIVAAQQGKEEVPRPEGDQSNEWDDEPPFYSRAESFAAWIVRLEAKSHQLHELNDDLRLILGKWMFAQEDFKLTQAAKSPLRPISQQNYELSDGTWL